MGNCAMEISAICAFLILTTLPIVCSILLKKKSETTINEYSTSRPSLKVYKKSFWIQYEVDTFMLQEITDPNEVMIYDHLIG